MILSKEHDELRVLHVTNMWPVEEAPHYGSFVKSQVSSLQHAGISCDIAHSNEYGIAKYMEIRTITRQKILDFNPDLVHAHFGWTGAAITSICQSHNIPLVISYCGGDINGESGTFMRRSKYRIGTWLSLWAGDRAKHLIVKSKNMYEELPKRLQSKSTLLPNGVDMTLFSPLPRDKARSLLGWRANQFVVLFAGRSEDPTKNKVLADKAIEMVREQIPDLTLKSPQNIPHKQMPLWLSASDVLLMTSHKEGSPNIVKEALACDLPVVSVPVGDVSYVINGVKNSRLVAYEARSIADALMTVRSKGVVSEGEGRKKLFDLKMDSPFVASHLISIYKAALQKT